jgi:5'-nucleotidase
LRDDHYAVDGTPADCVRLGLTQFVPEAHWVVAGINDGGNLGVDIYMSGTIAAAREGVLCERPAMAFSQLRRRDVPIDWQAAEAMTGHVLETLWTRSLEPGSFWNVNLPLANRVDNRSDIIFCPIDHSQVPVDYELRDSRYYYRGVYQERDRKPGADVDVCFSGRIAVTQVTLYPPG